MTISKLIWLSYRADVSRFMLLDYDILDYVTDYVTMTGFK